MPLSTEQQRLVSMLDYLEEWDKLNRTPVFSVTDHQGGFLAWQADLEGQPSIQLNVADASGEIWMEIARLRPVRPPAPPATLIPWLIIKDDPFAEPIHRESLPGLEPPERPQIFEENADLAAAFNAYGRFHARCRTTC